MTGQWSEDEVDYYNALGRAEEAAANHLPALTPGLEITETDPGYIVLYEDLQRSQVSWRYLVEEMSEDHLYWLAGHLEQPPPGIAADRWAKLQANAWRARAAAQRRESDRSTKAQLAFQEHENERTRRSAENTAGTVSAFQREDNARSLAMTRAIAQSQEKFQAKENRANRLMILLGSLIGVGGVTIGVWLGQSDPPPDPMRVQVIEGSTTSASTTSSTTTTTSSTTTTTVAQPSAN